MCRLISVAWGIGSGGIPRFGGGGGWCNRARGFSFRLDSANPPASLPVRERIASAFVTKQGKGRIVLAGDAAHVHSVNGGQGLNTGIADAFGLIWRLKLACDMGKAAADRTGVISTYDLERRTIAQDVINVAARLVRDTMHTAEQYVATIEKNAGYITGE